LPVVEARPVNSALAVAVPDDEAEAVEDDATGVGAVVRVGSFVILPVAASLRSTTTSEPHSVQPTPLDSWAGPFVPGPALGLEVF
jgi:hypothetical protein